jgi:RNA polymerase sigma factor (sigma-70 family)
VSRRREQPWSNAEVDLSLARRCSTEEGGREELFQAFAPAVYRLARRLLGNGTDAEDVLQEVFIDVFASVSGYRGEAPLRSWIYRIAVRRTLRHRRRSSAPLELVRDGEGSDGVAAADSRATLRRLNTLLGRLSEDRRVIFILHEVEGYSLPEAAALLGISVTAAKKRAWRARRELERLARGDAALAPLFHRDRRDGDAGV